MTDVDLNLIECILKRFERENGVKKVVSVKVAPASGQGDNYSSNVLRTTVEVILGSGRKCKKSVIIKRMADGVETNKWLSEFSVFKREAEVMGVILPGMEGLMEEFEDYREIFWPKLIHHTPYSEIIIEDLKVYGYALEDRQRGFTLQQASLVMDHIGRFHAMSVVLKERGLFDPRGHYEHVLPHSKMMVKNYIQATFLTLSKYIMRDWGTEWQDVGIRLRQASNKVPEFMKKFGERDDTRFNVLNHGDLWAPNILFRYIKGQNDPVGMRLIDYQMTFYTTYAFDLNHFLYSSLSYEVRKNNFQDLLKIYHETLSETLEMYNFTSSKIPSFQDILDEMENTVFFALIAVVMIMSVVKSDPEFAVDFESVITPSDVMPVFDENIFNNKHYIPCLKECLMKFYYKGVF